VQQLIRDGLALDQIVDRPDREGRVDRLGIVPVGKVDDSSRIEIAAWIAERRLRQEASGPPG
jgi:hypothetical protein